MGMQIGDFKAQLAQLQQQAIKDQSVTKQQLDDLETKIDQLENISDDPAKTQSVKDQLHSQLKGLEVIADQAKDPSGKGTSVSNSQWESLMNSAVSLADDVVQKKDVNVSKTSSSDNKYFGTSQDGKTSLFNQDGSSLNTPAMGPNETRKIKDGLYANTDAQGKLTFDPTAAHDGTAMGGSVPKDSDAFKDKGQMAFDEKADMYFSKQQDGSTKVYDLNGKSIASVPKDQTANFKVTNPSGDQAANPYLQIAADGSHKWAAAPDANAQVQGTLTGDGNNSGGYAPAATDPTAAAAAKAVAPGGTAPADSPLKQALADPPGGVATPVDDGKGNTENMVEVKGKDGSYSFFNAGDGSLVGTLPKEGGTLFKTDNTGGNKAYNVGPDGKITQGDLNADYSDASKVLKVHGDGQGKYMPDDGGNFTSDVKSIIDKNSNSDLAKEAKGKMGDVVKKVPNEDMIEVKDGNTWKLYSTLDGKEITSVDSGKNLGIDTKKTNARYYTIDDKGVWTKINADDKATKVKGDGGGKWSND